jgi:hypothetical protein
MQIFNRRFRQRTDQPQAETERTEINLKALFPLLTPVKKCRVMSVKERAQKNCRAVNVE